MCLRGMALGEQGQFSAVRGGLCPQFRRAKSEPMLVEDLKPTAAGGKHAARVDGHLSSQRFAEPAAGARHRRTAPSTLRGGLEMPISVIVAAQI